MGYRTDAYGEIEVKSADVASEVVDIIRQLDIFGRITVNGSAIEVGVERTYYYPEDYLAMYEDIAEYVVSGYVEFTGDDGSKWLHEYENGEWLEYDGELKWVNPHSI